MKYELLKVFDCTDMPTEVQNCFWKMHEGKPNDIYVSFYPEWEDEKDKNSLAVLNWLKENGLEQSDKQVIIKHWW